MGKFKHKLTASDQRQIIELAKDLPAMARYDGKGDPIYKRQQMDGIQLLSNGVARTANGQRPVAGTIYMVPVLQYVDHQEQMRLIFRTEGLKGCEAYREEVIGRKQRMDMDAQRAGARQRWYNRPLIFLSRLWFRLWYRREQA